MVRDAYEVLSIAIRKNSLNLAKRVLQRSVLIKDEKWTDYVLLIKALQQGRKQIAELLLRSGCRVNRNSNTNFFHTPLYYAVRLGDTKIVSILLEKGALINRRDRNEETALYLAMRKKHFAIVKMMLSKYFCQNKYLHKYDSVHITAYYIACLTHNENAINNFINRGISVKYLETSCSWYKNDFKLHFAVHNEYVELVELLLKCGADVTERNAEGLTPLHLAILNYTQLRVHRYSTEKMIDLMLVHDHKVENCIDKNGISHFHIACTRNKPEVVENFLKRGVDVNMAISTESGILSCYTPLHCAADFHSISVIPVLLQYKADIYATDEEGFTPLHVTFVIYAKEGLDKYTSGNMIDLMLSIDNENNKNSINNYGLSHFHIACSRDNVKVVEGFLKHGVDVNMAISLESETLPGYTPLHCAVKFNNTNVVRLLLKHNANINAVNAKGLTPLHLAWIGKRKFFHRETSDSIIDMILQAHNENSDNSMDENGLSHFHIACTRNIPHVVEGFLKQGVKINTKVSYNARDLRSCTPLHCAVKYNRAAIVKLLLQHNADVNVFSIEGWTPLRVACDVSYNKTYELIRDDICAFEKNKKPSWRYPQVQPFGQCKEVNDWIRNRNDHLEIIRLLLKYKSNVNIKDRFNKPVLFESYINFKYEKIEKVIEVYVNRYTMNHVREIVYKEFLIRRKEIVKIFLDYNLNVNIRDDKAYSILHVLASDLYEDNGIIETAELLLSKGASVSARTVTGMTPLHLAVEKGYCRRDLVDLFLKHNANVSSVELDKHLTPLHLACKYFCEEPGQYQAIMKALIAKGADVNARDVDGLTPLYLACNAYEKAVVEILKHGADINILDNNRKTVLHYNLECYPASRSSYTVKGYDNFCVIREHIQKLKVLGLYVSSKIESFCLKLERKYYPMYNKNEFLNKCKAEVGKMKSIKIDNYSSLYDMIFKDINKMAVYVKNSTFTNIFNADDFEDEFHLYGYLLKLQYRKGLEREGLLNLAKDVLSFIIKLELPESCSENILQYFNNEQLKDLLKLQISTNSCSRNINLNTR